MRRSPAIPGSRGYTLPAIRPCCSCQCLFDPPEDSGQQVCMSSASRVGNRDRLPFVHSGLPGGASVCRLFLEWDGPTAGAPGVPGHGPSRRTRKLRLRERPCVSKGPPLPSRESGTQTQVHHPQSPYSSAPACRGQEGAVAPARLWPDLLAALASAQAVCVECTMGTGGSTKHCPFRTP